MGRALERAADSEILRSNPILTFLEGASTFRITTEGGRSIYSVTRGADTLRVPIQFAMGLGSAGQTYMYQRNGNWYKGRVSFFKAIGGLDLTLGHALIDPRNMQSDRFEAAAPKACRAASKIGVMTYSSPHLQITRADDFSRV
jgi:hypothetical protein